MTRPDPDVCVVIPVFNRADLLRQCLDSVSAQTFNHWECIVVDDGSTDGSLAVASEYATRDSRFMALARSSAVKGAAACRNTGLAACTAPFVLFLDSDDLLHPRCLDWRMAFVNKQAEVPEISIFPTLTFREHPGDSNILWNIDKSIPDILRFLRLDCPWSTTGALWRSDALRRIGGFEEKLPGWQDWQVHIVALLEGFSCVRAGGPPDSYWREHGNNQISDKASEASYIAPKIDYLIKLLRCYGTILKTDTILRDAAVGLVWRQLVFLQECGRLASTLSYWRTIRKLKYISRFTWLEGAAALVLHGHRGGGVAWSRIEKWPASVINSVDTSTRNAVCQEYTGLACR